MGTYVFGSTFFLLLGAMAGIEEGVGLFMFPRIFAQSAGSRFEKIRDEHRCLEYTVATMSSPEPVAEVSEPAKDNQAKNDDGLDKKTLFVRAVPPQTTNEELSEHFSQFAPVKHAVVVTDEKGESRGFGFVSFTMDDDTLTALVESKKVKFKGRVLRVDVAKRRDRKVERATRDTSDLKTRKVVEKRRARLIVRNLPWSCKEPEKLTKIFLRFGAVFEAYIPRKKGGQMSGFAFVTMKKQAAAEKAVKESVGLKIDGREVAVDLAIEKSKWEAEKEKEESEEEKEENESKDESKDEKDEDEEMANGSDEEAENDDNENDDNDDPDSDGDSDSFAELNDLESAPEVPEHKPRNKQEAYAVFVRNIPYDADQDSLTEHFSQFGPVKYALPVIDKETGVARGSAFVAFTSEKAYTACLDNAPSIDSTSVLIPDDVAREYVFEGRILSVTSAVDRSSALRLAEKNMERKKEALGKSPADKDKRNLYLLNEGRITENSKLAQYISKTDMELREKSYKLRAQQLNKNPTLHLSLTRLAIRNIPRSMNPKSLKALGRKAVVQFATEVKAEQRQPLSKEEVNRSIKLKHEDEVTELKKSKNAGVVKQAKVVMEVKGTGDVGRSRGYGFIEYRDHKAALMGLRWLNAHEVTPEEAVEGLTDEEKKAVRSKDSTKRRLIVEFAVENAQVVKRRKEKVMHARENNKRRAEEPEEEGRAAKKQKRTKSQKKGNMNKGPKDKGTSEPARASTHTEAEQRIISQKRRKRKGKK